MENNGSGSDYSELLKTVYGKLRKKLLTKEAPKLGK